MQTRSFLYIDECLEGTYRLINSDYHQPINIGSDEMISISNLADMIIEISGKRINKSFVPGPEGVRGRNSDNELIEKVLGWKPSMPLKEGIKRNYEWILKQILKENYKTVLSFHSPQISELLFSSSASILA
jgi:GDP-D-mannose 3',5'-epimerase